jgi:hypothetical protein
VSVSPRPPRSCASAARRTARSRRLAIAAPGCKQAIVVLALAGPAATDLAPLLPPLFTGRVPTLPPGFTNERAEIAVRAAAAYWHIAGDATSTVPALLR